MIYADSFVGNEIAAPPDLVRRDFTSPVPTHRLVGGITYLRTGEGWLYLATVIDLCTRMVVGWAISERMTADIVVSALETARGAATWRRARSSTATGGRNTPAGCWPGGPRRTA